MDEGRKSKLDKELEGIFQTESDLPIEQMMVKGEDLPGFGNTPIYDYEKDVDESIDKAKGIITSLADLYLGDSKKAIEHPYIKNKIEEDAAIYAESIYLNKWSRRLIIKLMEQIDSGDAGARMYEVYNQLLKQMADSNKDNRTSKTEIEKFYRDLRIDLGLNDELGAMGGKGGDDSDDETEGSGGEKKKIFNAMDLNDEIDEMLRGRDAKK